MFTKFTALRLSSAAFLLLFAISSLNASSLFGPVRIYKSGVTYEESVAVGDVNGDGKLDLLTIGEYSLEYGYSSAQVGVLLATADGKFGHSWVYYSGGTFPQAIALADVNGDGNLDVLVANYENIGVLLGNGDGTFQGSQNFGSGAHGIAVADLNGDGKLDLLLATDGAAEVRLGNGDGTFQLAQNYATWGYAIAASDVNRDGKLDMVMAGPGLFVLLGNGDGTFQSAAVYSSGGNWPNSLRVADINGDGNADLVVSNLASSNVGVLLGNGDGTFQPVQTYDSGGAEAVMLVVEDFNGDGKPDLAVANHYGANGKSVVGMLLGNGDGTFQAAQTFSIGGYGGGSIAVGNLTGSNMPDLLVSRCRIIRHCVEGMLVVLPNMTKGFITTTTLSSSLNPSNHGQAVTFTVTVSSAGPAPTGKVKFLDETTGVGTVALSGGIATLTKSKLAVGMHPITAQYLGDAVSDKSTSPVVNQEVR